MGGLEGDVGKYLEMGAWNSRDGMNNRDLEAICRRAKAREADDFTEEESKEKESALTPVPWTTNRIHNFCFCFCLSRGNVINK